MHFISSLLFGISANIDSFIVGASYGIKKSHISLAKSILISLITMAGTVISILLGTEIVAFIPAHAAEILGSALLILLGLYYMIKGLLQYWKEHFPDEDAVKIEDLYKINISPAPVRTADCLASSTVDSVLPDFSIPDSQSDTKAAISPMSLKEGIFLGLALSVNNFGMGIAASISGLTLFPAAVISLILAILFLYAGNTFGKSRIFQMSGQAADLVSGLILITLSLYEFFI